MRIYLTKIIFLTMIFSGCNYNPNQKTDNVQQDWKSVFNSELPVFGHRNWIIVADAAYPKQSSPGIQTISTGENHMEVLKYVFEKINKAPHIYPVIYLDAELKIVREEDSKGVEAYREDIRKLFQDSEVKYLPHEDIIKRLDETGKMFNILMLKTDLTIPYTSVFMELGCGYWDSEKESRMRKEFDASTELD